MGRKAEGGHGDGVAVPAARTGRPRRSSAPVSRGQLVRVEVRLPALVAAALFERARSQGVGMSRTAASLLAGALGVAEDAAG